MRADEEDSIVGFPSVSQELPQIIGRENGENPLPRSLEQSNLDGERVEETSAKSMVQDGSERD